MNIRHFLGTLPVLFLCCVDSPAQVAAEVEKFFGSSVYKTRIPRNVRIAEAPSHGEPVIKYDRISKGSRAYLHLADEFIRREE